MSSGDDESERIPWMKMPSGELRVVDLSVLVSESLPASWPGHMPFTHKNWNWYAEVENPIDPVRSVGPYRTNFFVMDEHCGTHMDGPTHFIPPPGWDWSTRGRWARSPATRSTSSSCGAPPRSST
jgi:hypothetical protein